MMICYIMINMKYSKMIRDWLFKAYNMRLVPSGLVEIQKYFRNNKNIGFDTYNEEGVIVAVSNNFRYGSIVTSGKTLTELDTNIRDAILTSFSIPSAYAKEAEINRIVSKPEEKLAYAAA